MIGPWWGACQGPVLAQGDLIPDCVLPIFADAISTGSGEIVDLDTVKANLIVATQTCDLQNNKAQFVACCVTYTIDEFEAAFPQYRTKGRWETVRKGREESLHLIASPITPNDNRTALVVDFGHLVSLPLAYVSRHSGCIGQRWRLNSPYLEHYSQALARFFMRVGLPSTLPPFA